MLITDTCTHALRLSGAELGLWSCSTFAAFAFAFAGVINHESSLSYSLV